MDHVRYEFILRAQTPIAHHSEVFGNEAIYMRRKTRQPDGSFVDIPIVTADTMRHGMREAAAYALLEAAGLSEATALSEAALRLLFAGGMVTGRGDGGAVKLSLYREMCDLVPSMAIFGGCANNRVIPGQLTVEDAVLICEETVHSLPTWVGEWLAEQRIALSSCRSHIDSEQRVRMDPTLDPKKQRLLSVDERATIERRLLKGEVAHDTDDAAGRETSKSSMMPRTSEVVCSGSIFLWSFSAVCYSELDRDTLHVAARSFLYDARVGGKRGTGHGKIIPLAGRRVDVRAYADRAAALDYGEQGERTGVRRVEDAVEELALAVPEQVGDIFRRHVAERADRVRAFLAVVDA